MRLVRRVFTNDWWGIAALAVMTLIVGAVYFFTGGTEKTHELLKVLFEALVVALSLAIAVDLFVKKRFAREVADTMFWAVLNPDSPEPHKTEVRKIADQRTVLESVRWKAYFEWGVADPTMVVLTAEVSTNGRSYHRNGYRPTGKAYAVASDGLEKTAYLAYSFSGGTDSQERTIHVMLDEAQGQYIGDFITAMPDGRLELRQGDIFEKLVDSDLRVAYRQTFQVQRKVRWVKYAHGSMPFTNGTTTLATTFLVCGPAASSLDFTLLDLTAGTATDMTPDHQHKIEPLGPGRSIVLSWAPKPIPG